MTTDELIKLKTWFIQTFKTEPGHKALQYIMSDLCGFNKHNIVVNNQTGELLTNAMLYNEARRSVYVSMRGLLVPEIIQRVESAGPLFPKKETEKKKEHPYIKRHVNKGE